MKDLVWACRVVAGPEGRLVIELPDSLVAALGVDAGGTVEIATARNKMFDLWTSLPAGDQNGRSHGEDVTQILSRDTFSGRRRGG